jgi:glycosyltransferase involved in cell wall biosynthesis
VQANLMAIRGYLRQRQVPCRVINLTRHRQADMDGLHYPKHGLAVLWLLARLPHDVAHLHVGGDFNLRLLGLALVCGLWPGRKAVLTFHSGGYPSSPAGRRAHPRSVRGFVLRRLDHVVAVNSDIAALFARFGLDPARVSVIPPFAVPPPDAQAALPERPRAFFESHRPVLTTVGLLEPEYDLSLQLEALGQVRARHPRAGLAIVGSGSLEADLRRRIDALPYREHVLLCGDLPHAATLRAIAQSDLLLRTTLYDGDSVAVREALHLGTPVIASDNGLRPAGVHLVPRSDLAALVRAIEERLGGARAPADQGGSGEENLEAVFRIYEALAAERAPAGPRVPASSRS